MIEVDLVVDGLIAGSQGASSLAVSETRLRIERWTLLPSRSDRIDQLWLIEEASQILNELAMAYVE